jgi:phosphinothricin acetyltransferase
LRFACPAFDETMRAMRIVQCDFDCHAAAILAIFNDAILNSTALYDYKARTMDNMRAWFETKAKGNFPVIGLENDAGELMGFGSFGTFRPHAAYKYSVEHSIYVDARFRSQGLGRKLLEEVIATAKAQDYHNIIGVIDTNNQQSIGLHESLGFTHCGTVKHCGFKFGRWLDAAFYQLILATPTNPVDG